MLENNHFVIYENAMFNESFEKDIAYGNYSVEQLKTLFKENRLSPEQLRIFKENASYSGKYSKEVIEEIFSSAPTQRGMFKRGFDKLTGALGSVKGQTHSKLSEQYYKAWNQYDTIIKKRSVVGQPEHTLGLAKKVLANMGVSDNAIQQTHVKFFNNIVDDAAVGKEDIGQFISEALKEFYAQDMGTNDVNARIARRI
jgi:hypothetical protein